MDTIASRIATLVDAHGARRDDLWRMLDRFHEVHREAEKLLGARLLRFVLSWLAFLAISGSWVREGSWGFVKLEEPALLLFVAAPMMGYFHYSLSSAAAASTAGLHAVSHLYGVLVPTARTLNLDFLTMHPSFAAIERILDPGEGGGWLRLLHAWGVPLGLFITVGSLFAMGQLWWNCRAFFCHETLALALSLAVGIVFYLRGLLVAWRSWTLTTGSVRS